MKKYRIQPGDTFYLLAERIGTTWQDFIQCNPGVDPNCLEVGQIINLPSLKKSDWQGQEQYMEISSHAGQQYSGDNLDDVEMEIEGVRFRVKRIGESNIPHEIQLTVPRTEIRKVQPYGENGPCEVQIMLSNVNIIHSPRLMSEKPYSQGAETIEVSQPTEMTQSTQNGQPSDTPLAQIDELRYDIRPDSPRPR